MNTCTDCLHWREKCQHPKGPKLVKVLFFRMCDNHQNVHDMVDVVALLAWCKTARSRYV